MSIPGQEPKTGKWGAPVPYYNENTGQWEDAGAVWQGTGEPTEEDYAILEGGPYDPMSIVGLYHEDWSTYFDHKNDTDPAKKLGGRGSTAYECQNTGEGVEFWNTTMGDEAGYYYTADGKLTWGIPENLGAYHKTPKGYVEGPEPGSEAEKLLGNGRYAYNGNKGWYVVK